MVTYALESLNRSTYTNWHVAFVDDGSDNPGLETLKRLIPDESKWTYYNTGLSPQQKLAQGGSNFGAYWNKAIQEIEADACLMLCDDDALLPSYLENLNTYFTNNPDVYHVYSHIVEYNPFEMLDFEQLSEPSYKKASAYNPTESINAFCRVDAAQVAWRRSCNLDKQIWFPSPQTVALDAILYQQLYNFYGPCRFTGFDGELKGFYSKQLSHRHGENQYSTSIDLEAPKY